MCGSCVVHGVVQVSGDAKKTDAMATLDYDEFVECLTRCARDKYGEIKLMTLAEGVRAASSRAHTSCIRSTSSLRPCCTQRVAAAVRGAGWFVQRPSVAWRAAMGMGLSSASSSTAVSRARHELALSVSTRCAICGRRRALHVAAGAVSAARGMRISGCTADIDVSTSLLRS